MMQGNERAVLHGIRVVEFATGVAAPLCGTLLADLGADVVHVEPTTGDTQRRVGPAKDGVPLWWKAAARNKRSVALDIDAPAARDLVARLVAWAHVVVVSDHNERLIPRGLDWTHVHRLNPKAVLLQITGCGATTPIALDTGAGIVSEARSGIAQMTGRADGPPMHSGFDHADGTTAVMGAFAVCASLARRNTPGFAGEWIDLATYETLFRIVEWQVVLQDVTGYTSARAGNRLGVAPGAVINTYRTADDVWLTVSASTLRPVRNVAKLLDEPDEMYATVADQFANAPRLDALLATWVSERTAEEALKVMAELGVVASRIYDMDDIATDQTYAERGDIVAVPDVDLGVVRMPGVIPKLHLRPGAVRHTGPALDADHDLIFRQWLGIDDADLAAARRAGAFGDPVSAPA